VQGVDTVSVSDIDLAFLGDGFFAQARDVLQDMHRMMADDAESVKKSGVGRSE